MGDNWTEYTKTMLLKLPDRDWSKNAETIYDFILVVPTRLKHDSGYSCIALIGCVGDAPVEILAYPDDIELPKSDDPNYFMGFRMDSSYPHGVLRLWSNRYRFKVGIPVSSTEIIAVARELATPPNKESRSK